MEFWKLAYQKKWTTINQLKMAVKTNSNPYGQISPDEFKIISGEDYVQL